MKFTNGTYDILKVVALIVLPLAALVTSLSDIWGIPYGQQISQTLIALNVFLGAVLKQSSDAYHEGAYDELDTRDPDDN